MTITRECPAAQHNQDMNQNRRFPFTKVWIDLITLLQDKVTMKRRYIVRTAAESVFTGANAVDVLLRHVRTNPELFPNQNFGRSNCVRLCQRFLDLRVFLPANAKEASQLKINFADSKFAFYRFNENNDFIGAPKVTRCMKRCNSETDLNIVNPKQAKVTSSSNLMKLVPKNLRRSIRRRSSSKPAGELDAIDEHSVPATSELDTTLPVISEGSRVTDTPSRKRRLSRSNAFKLRSSRKSSTSLTAFESMEDLSSVGATPKSVRRRSFAMMVSRRSSLEARKKVKSVANFNLSLSIAL